MMAPSSLPEVGAIVLRQWRGRVGQFLVRIICDLRRMP
jgi:hypothetical protein